MWKRDETVRPIGEAEPTYGQAQRAAVGTVAGIQARGTTVERNNAESKIGKTVTINGEIKGDEDLTIEGHLVGTIQLGQSELTIGPNGRVEAEIFAKSVTVIGEVIGSITATEQISISDNGSVDGDLVSPRVSIPEGAHFCGSIDMKQPQPADGRSVEVTAKKSGVVTDEKSGVLRTEQKLTKQEIRSGNRPAMKVAPAVHR